MREKLFFCLVLLLAFGCDDSSDAASDAAASASGACANGPSEGGCGTECAINPSACAEGFYCGSDGLCSADCNASIPCASVGQSCSADGRCFSQSTAPDTDAGTEPESCVDEIAVVIRDFEQSHPDFERAIAAEQDIVLDNLGSDDKPVFNQAKHTTTPFATVESKESFDQWYRDVESINKRIKYTLTLKRNSDGHLYYDSEDEFPSSSFFPIDGKGFGNTAGESHNYHFTMELHSSFTYSGGEVFTFRGDDDLFLFINGKKAIDLGGVHGPETGNADMDALASELGIEIGKTYELDLFFAERHTTLSNFRIETSIECIVSNDDEVF